MPHVWKISGSSANEIHYVPTERERARTNDQGRKPTTKEETPRPKNEGDVQTRAEPTKQKGEVRSQRSNPKPYPNTIGRDKDQEQPLRSATLGQELSSKPQAQVATCREVWLDHTSGGEARNQG